MNKNLIITITSTLLLLLIIVYTVFFSNYGYYERKELKNHQNVLMKDNLELSAKIEEKKAINECLRDTNSFQIERIAREKYGMKKEGEVFIELK